MIRSSSYMFTASVDSQADMDRITLLRQAVKLSNKHFKETGKGQKLRVVLRGRKPKTKGFVTNFWTSKTSYRAYDRGGNIYGGIKNATVIDVYVYTRY